MNNGFQLSEFGSFDDIENYCNSWDERYRESILPSGFEVLDFYIEGFQKKSVWILYSPEREVSLNYVQNVSMSLEGRNRKPELISGCWKDVFSKINDVLPEDSDFLFIDCNDQNFDIDEAISLARKKADDLNIPIIILCPRSVVNNAFPTGEYSKSGFRKFVLVRRQVNGILAMTRSRASIKDSKKLDVDMTILHQRNGVINVNIELEYDKHKQVFKEKKGQLDKFVKEKPDENFDHLWGALRC